MRKYVVLILVLSTWCMIYAKTGKEIIREHGFKPSVAPLLKTHWSQNGGENSQLPLLDGEGSQRAVTGCGATATAQIMNFWKYPIHGNGDNYYVWTAPDGKRSVLYADFEHTYYDWDNMIPVYKNNSSATQEQIDAVSTLMLHIGVALEMNYSTSTATQIEYIHTVLKKYFGYNKNSQLVRFIHGAYTMDEWLTMIYKELSEGRPVLMGGRYQGDLAPMGADHIFVADGYDENGNVHLNLGKADIGFNKDTYYDLTRTDQTYTRNMRMIIGICPETLEGNIVTVNVTSPGTLIEQLGGEVASRKICRLKISGYLNSSDIEWLAELTRTTTGQLSYLDLSQCTIEGDAILDSSFKLCCEQNYTLQEIVLPNSIKRIEKYAFNDCSGLWKVHIPNDLEYLGYNAFYCCRYLEEINLPSHLKQIVRNPFVYTKTNLLKVDKTSPFFQEINNAIISKDGKTLYSLPVKCIGGYIVSQGVETINHEAFYKVCKMTSVELPATLKQIGTNSFGECYSLKDVFCHATSAPKIEGDSFDTSVSNCILHVPAGCIEEYQQKGWTMFAQIVDDVEKTNSDIIAENGFKAEVPSLLQTKWSKNDEVLSAKFPEYNDGITTQRITPSSGAVSMAQVMNYWQARISGKDKLFFAQHNKGDAMFSADFSSAHYDWNNMVDDCSNANNLNAQQRNAVAELVYHCAVATFDKELPANKDGATQLEYCSSALKRFFGFNPDMHLLSSRFYELEEWIKIIYKELSGGRPVMVECVNSDYDEVYIIDGYNSEGLLHVIRDGADSYLSPDDASIYADNISILVGVTPNEIVEDPVIVHLSSAGTLVANLADKSTTVTKLKLTGTLNDSDITALKGMAQYGKGQLYYLDLSEAAIEGNALNGYSFQYCDLLQYIKLPSNLEQIGRHGFSYCYNLLNIEFPNVKDIDNYAFFFCRYLDDVSIPSTLSSIGDNPFGSNKMNHFTTENNNVFKFEGSALKSLNGQILYSCLGSFEGEYVIPIGVTKVRNMAFRGCDGITSLVIPETIRSIGTYSFYECYNLKDVYCCSTTAPSLSSDMDSYAFYPECATCTLHVPAGCVTEYTQKNWDKFAKIVDDIVTEGINSVSGLVESDGKIYSVDGLQVSKPLPNHIYIIKDRNGNSKKYVER